VNIAPPERLMSVPAACFVIVIVIFV